LSSSVTFAARPESAYALDFPRIEPNQYFENMKKILLSAFLTFIVAFSSRAALVDTVQTYSPSMKKNIKAIVITPDSYSAGKEFPVIYLLHGYSGNYKDWVKMGKGVDKLADAFNIIYVLPDGSTSWYFDSPVRKDFMYETYVSNELVNWVDQKYKTIKDRKGRAITGLSMGGHGALYLAFRHQDVFGAAGSMSGGVDFRPFPNNWDLSKNLGKYAEQPENWEKNTVINLVHLLTPNSLSLIIDCGVDDFFYLVNQNLHNKLLERNIPHDYITRPGAHNWEYWNNAIQYQTLFMSRYFSQR
jgi:S-formylglutathione hydrolase FrmB